MIYIEPDGDSGDIFDTREDALKTLKKAVESLNDQVSALQSSLATTNNNVSEISDDTIPSLVTSLNATTASLNRLQKVFTLDGSDTSLKDLTEVSANGIKADSVTSSDYVRSARDITDNLTVLEDATVTGTADVGKIKALTSDIASLSADVANFATSLNTPKATVTDLEATNFDIENFDIEDLSTDNLTVRILASIARLTATISTVGTLYNELITPNPTSDWIVPGFTPDNTHLTKITIPDYRGILNFVTENGYISICIFNNSYITYSQKNFYFYHVQFNTASVDLYFANVGVAVNFKLMLMGALQVIKDNVKIELVDITSIGDEHNITELKGAISVTPVTSAGSTDVTFQYLHELPSFGTDKCIYIIEPEGDTGNVQTYVYVSAEARFIPVSLTKETTSLDFVTQFKDKEATSTYDGSDIHFTTSKNVYDSVKPLMEAVRDAIANIGNLADNIVYNSVDTYDRADAEKGITSLKTYPDPTGKGIFLLLVKQDESQGVRYVDEEGNDVYFSTIYLWQTSVETPSWTLVGKLNISEKSMALAVQSAIEKYIYKTDKNDNATDVTRFIPRGENSYVSNIVLDNARNGFINEPVLSGTKSVYVTYSEEDGYKMFDSTGEVTDTVGAWFTQNGDYVLLGTTKFYTYKELANAIYCNGYTASDTTVPIVYYHYSDATTIKEFISSSSVNVLYVDVLPDTPLPTTFYVTTYRNMTEN